MKEIWEEHFSVILTRNHLEQINPISPSPEKLTLTSDKLPGLGTFVVIYLSPNALILKGKIR